MDNKAFSVPILFLVFNRPDTTKTVFEKIRKIRPARLFIAADGPRAGREDDAQKCAEVKRIVGGVDWPCEVTTLFREKNLGCRKALSSAITWFFEQVEEGVILEDDCMPDISFFAYAGELLERYRNDERIGMICGTNLQFGARPRTDFSYYFSRYNHVWGWAGWRRVWRNYDVDMKMWNEIKSGGWLNDFMDNVAQVKYWTGVFDAVSQNQINTWDYQLFLTFIMNNYLSIIPNVNLISNIGYSKDATHTFDEKDIVSKMKTESIECPLRHPNFIIRDKTADERVEKVFFRSHGLIELIKHNVKTSIKKVLKIKKR
ncbi:MAG: hypothetical protein BWY32_01898 [bacterium ADurb.Bin243]|nr:MAG: hypothetical protein BWY32_01898 [bacterium ADurb.Bin243]